MIQKTPDTHSSSSVPGRSFPFASVQRSIGVHIRAQEGIVQVTVNSSARSPHIRPQRKFACSSSFQISFIFVPSFPAFSHSSTDLGISISIPHKVCGFVVRIIFPNTQFVNRLIPFFSILHFVHDERPLRGAVPCAFRSRVLLCLISRPVRRRTPAQIHALVTKRQNLHLIIRPE